MKSQVSNNSRLSTKQEKGTCYRLVAVLEHLGNAYGGHFVAYRLVEFHNEKGYSTRIWYRCSDDVIQEVKEAYVLKMAQSYMCFYEKLNL